MRVSYLLCAAWMVFFLAAATKSTVVRRHPGDHARTRRVSTPAQPLPLPTKHAPQRPAKKAVIAAEESDRLDHSLSQPRSPGPFIEPAAAPPWRPELQHRHAILPIRHLDLQVLLI